jgi:DNA-binding YbaB/EbfC family protein
MKNLMGGGDNMMRQVRQMQEQLKQTQKELEKETVSGSAGGGIIEIVMSGSQRCMEVHFDAEKLINMKPENLEGLIKLAINDALDKSRKLMAKKIGPLGGGLAGLKF